MKSVVMKIALPLMILGLTGCASMRAKEDQIDSTVSSQADVLRKIVNLRSQDDVKTRLNSDPVLAEQETVLIKGLESVISSQEAFLKARKDANELGEIHVP